MMKGSVRAHFPKLSAGLPPPFMRLLDELNCGNADVGVELAVQIRRLGALAEQLGPALHEPRLVQALADIEATLLDRLSKVGKNQPAASSVDVTIMIAVLEERLALMSTSLGPAGHTASRR